MNNHRERENTRIVRRTLENFARDYRAMETDSGREGCDNAAYEFIATVVDKREQQDYVRYYDNKKEVKQ